MNNKTYELSENLFSTIEIQKLVLSFWELGCTSAKKECNYWISNEGSFPYKVKIIPYWFGMVIVCTMLFGIKSTIKSQLLKCTGSPNSYLTKVIAIFNMKTKWYWSYVGRFQTSINISFMWCIAIGLKISCLFTILHQRYLLRMTYLTMIIYMYFN